MFFCDVCQESVCSYIGNIATKKSMFNWRKIS